MKTLRNATLAVAATAVAATALVSAGSALGARSAPGPNLRTTIAQPSGMSVYQSGRWSVTVANAGNRDASNVILTVQLPRTAVSPNPGIMGTLGAMHPSCSRVGLTLSCNLSTVARFTGSKTVWFDITLPYSTNPIVMNASAPAAGDQNPADNTAAPVTASLATYAVSWTPARTVLVTHCTGTNALSSFIECVPGSTASFTAQLGAGSTAGSGPVTTAAGGGTWTQAGTALAIDFEDGSPVVAAAFRGQGTGASCWEGKTTFPQSTSSYIAIYQVCLQ